jgi:hypothetical protein
MGYNDRKKAPDELRKEQKLKIRSLVEFPISVTEIFPCGQVNFPLENIPLYQDIKIPLDTTIPID